MFFYRVGHSYGMSGLSLPIRSVLASNTRSHQSVGGYLVRTIDDMKGSGGSENHFDYSGSVLEKVPLNN